MASMDGDLYLHRLAQWVATEGKRLSERSTKSPATLTLHHLYYLLTRFDDLEVSIGPLNVRLEALEADVQCTGRGASYRVSSGDAAGGGSGRSSGSAGYTGSGGGGGGAGGGNSNYVSFSRRDSDAASIRSVSSIRSIASTFGNSIWNGFGAWGGAAQRSEEQIVQDLKQLYSAFCKIPTVRLQPSKQPAPIAGYEEYPFDTAVPMQAFKNLQFLEIIDYPVTSLYGWDTLADQLRSLVCRRVGLGDVAELTIVAIRREQAIKRRRAERATRHWQPQASGDVYHTGSSSGLASPRFGGLSRASSSTGVHPQRSYSKQGSASPTELAKQTSTKYASGVQIDRNLSNSSVDSNHSRGGARRIPSSGNLLASDQHLAQSTKWRFLRFLSLAENGLTEVSEQALAPLVNSLHFLDLSRNRFAKVPTALASLTHLRSLDLSHNALETLHSLAQRPLPCIATLNLRGNKLKQLAGIEKCPSLERIDLRDNAMKDPTEIARLQGMPGMKELFVAGNPFCRLHTDYRVTIFNVFRGNPEIREDVLVDGRAPGMLEKRSLVPRAEEIIPPPPTTIALTQAASAPGTPAKKVGRNTDAGTAVAVSLSPTRSTKSANTITATSAATASAAAAAAAGRVSQERERDRDRTRSPSVHKTKRKPHKSRIIDLSTDALDISPVPAAAETDRPAAQAGQTVQTAQAGQTAQQAQKAQTAHNAKKAQVNGVSTATRSVDGSTRHDEASKAQANVDEDYFAPKVKSPELLQPTTAIGVGADVGSDTAEAVESEADRAAAYRRRIEQLKREVGSEWLSVLHGDR